ncbi:MAG: hypothetical protein JW741_24710 [Sedimentisphaerales bacterium]|nr:hypothetical protein [Sedimentisphaerales bacterium]
MGETREDAPRLVWDRQVKLPLGAAVPVLLFSALICTQKAQGANRPSGMDAATRAKYNAAAPLNHTVKITRAGSVLKLDYELVGTDGKTYSLWKIRDRSKPTFSVYRDNVKVGAGTFEFG